MGAMSEMLEELSPSVECFKCEGATRYSWSHLGCRGATLVGPYAEFCRSLEELVGCRAC